MTLKDKAKTYNFWISLASAIVLIVRIIGNKFNIFIDTTLIMDITTGLCSIFVILGILSAPKSKTESTNQTSKETNLNQEENPALPTDSLDSLDETKETESEEKSEEPLVDNNIIDELPQDKPQVDTDNSQLIEDSNQPASDKIKEIINIIPTDDKINLKEVVEILRKDIHKANIVVEKLTKDIN